MRQQLGFFEALSPLSLAPLPFLLLAFDSPAAQATPRDSQLTAAPPSTPAAAPAPADVSGPAFVPPRAIPSSVMTNWPVYSLAARQAHREGVVLLSVKISRDGTPLDVKLARSSNFADLDAAAVLAVRKWKFTPATLNGAPSETTVNLPVRFSLKTAEKTLAPVDATVAATPAITKPAPVKPKPKVAKIVPDPKPAAMKPKPSAPPSAPASPDTAPAEPKQ